jgi:hypothetical protein
VRTLAFCTTWHIGRLARVACPPFRRHGFSGFCYGGSVLCVDGMREPRALTRMRYRMSDELKSRHPFGRWCRLRSTLRLFNLVTVANLPDPVYDDPIAYSDPLLDDGHVVRTVLNDDLATMCDMLLVYDVNVSLA